MAELRPKEMTVGIVYDESGNMYPAGEAVTGHVVIEVQEPITLGGLRIYFEGKGRVSWNGLASVNTAREIYLSESQEILDAENSLYTSLNLTPGIYRYPFSLRLPANLPASYSGYSSHGYVRYKARATVEGPWKANRFCVESEFLVCRSVDLNRESTKLRAPVQVQKEMSLSGGCFGDGYINAEFVISRRCFVAGEKILLNGSVEYMTNSRVRKTTVAIVQKVTLHKHPKKHKLRRIVSKVDGPSASASYGRGLWENVELVVPFVQTSRMTGCNLIDIEYWIEIFVHFALPCANVSRKLTSIIIGDVPLQSPSQSSPSSTPSSETMTTSNAQRLKPRGHRSETDPQGPRSGSWGTQWDMIHWMPPATTASDVRTGSDQPHRSPPNTAQTHADNHESERNGDCFALTPIHESSAIVDIHEEPKTFTNDDIQTR